MSDIEAKMAEALAGCFFWEKTSYYDGNGGPHSVKIRAAQRKYFDPGKPSFNRKVVSGLKFDLKNAVPEETVGFLRSAVAKLYGIDADGITDATVKHGLSDPKAHFYWAIKRYIPGISFVEAGRLVGRNHSTIIHGVRLFERRKTDKVEQILALDEVMGFESDEKGHIIKA